MVKLSATGVLCAAFIALGSVPAKALDPHTALAQYGYQSWQTDSGLPQNTVHAIVQGRDGYLWIATEGGMVRFDGVDFRAYTRANAPGLPSDLIDDLMEDRDGTLWVSTSGGLARMRGGVGGGLWGCTWDSGDAGLADISGWARRGVGSDGGGAVSD
jgi:ligand-binding sensor domain-containing protein